MRYFEAKNTDFSFITRPEYPAADPSRSCAVDEHWAKVTASNSSAFNGRIICCNGVVSESPGQVSFGINQSDYATYNYARTKRLGTNGLYAVGDATIIYLPAEDSYVFVARSPDGVLFDGDKISVGSGGVLSAPDNPIPDSQFMEYVSAHAVEETLEELEVAGLQESIFLGLYLDVTINKLEFLFATIATKCALKNNENTQLLTIKRGEVTTFFQDKFSTLETSTRNHLEYWATLLDEGIFI